MRLRRGRPGHEHLAGVLAHRVLLAAILAALGVDIARAADSLKATWQVGASNDVTNEQFYQDAYVDTTFLGRRLYGTPEIRTAAVASLELVGRNAKAWAYTLRPDLAVGDKILRGAISGSLRSDRVEGWNWRLDPALEGLRDQSFGFERREFRSQLVGRVRRVLGAEREHSVEFRGGGDIFRAARETGSYSLSRNGVRLGASYEHVPWLSWEYRAEHLTHLRTFPDSSRRDHLEHQWTLGTRRDFGGAHTFVLETDIQWRRTLTPQASTRDRFVGLQPRAELTLRSGLSNSLSLSLENDAFRYVEPDSAVDFDYDITRARISLRHEAGKGWVFSAGPRYEVLSSPWNTTERYREWAAVVEAERFAVSSWLAFAPVVSWRTYESSSAGSGFDTQAVHSSYVGYELFAMVDQSLPGRLRLRATGNGRLERHSDSSQDSRGFYFSLDVRRLF